MTTLKCADFPIRSVIIDGKRHNALVIKTRHGVIYCGGLPINVEYFQIKVDKEITYNAFKPNDFINYCRSHRRTMGVSEKDLKRVDRNGDCFLIASERYEKETRSWTVVNVSDDIYPGDKELCSFLVAPSKP